jgi:hypothetical protein
MDIRLRQQKEKERDQYSNQNILVWLIQSIIQQLLQITYLVSSIKSREIE